MPRHGSHRLTRRQRVKGWGTMGNRLFLCVWFLQKSMGDAGEDSLGLASLSNFFELWDLWTLPSYLVFRAGGKCESR